MPIDTPWQRLFYGTDLAWCANDWTTPVTVGNAEAWLSYRRKDDLVFATLYVAIGTTTSMPGGGFAFEAPAGAFFADTSYAGPAPTYATGAAFIVQVAAPNYCYTGFARAKPSLGLAGGDRPAIALFFPVNGVGGSGDLSSTYPWTLAAGDYFSTSFWLPFTGN